MNFVRLSILLITFPFISLAQGDEEVANGIYIGRSLYFWVLIFAMVYLVYSYYKSKDRKIFFKNSFLLSLTLCTGLLLSGFLFNNIFFHETKRKTLSLIEEEPSIEKQLARDEQLKQIAELDFINPENHYNYITHHVQMPVHWIIDYHEYERDDYSIVNFYTDRLYFSDHRYVDQARLSLGMFYFYSENYNDCYRFLTSIENKNLNYYNYYFGKLAEKLQDTSVAIQKYKAGILTENSNAKAECYKHLVKLLEAKNMDTELKEILYSDEGKQYVSYEKSRKIFFYENNIIAYYGIVLKNAFRNFNWTAFIAALLVLIIWLIYILRLDVFQKEHYGLVLLILIYGMGFSLLSFYLYDLFNFSFSFRQTGSPFNDLLFCIFGIGFIEELVKIIPLLILYLFFRSHLDEAYDYILFACVSALGFAFIENIFYFGGNMEGTIQGRALTSVPGHMIDSSIAAYGFVLSKFRYKKFPLYYSVPIFFLFACITHGLYDYFLFFNMLPIFLFVFLFSVSIWVIIINNCINNSPHFSYRLKFGSNNLQIFMTVAFTFTLVLQYLIIGWEKGPKASNHAFTGELFFSGFFIVYYTDRLTNMDLVRGYWNSISLRSIQEKRKNYPFNLRLFFIRLISGDIIPHKFVGSRITVMAERNNHMLLQYFADVVTATITDRVVVTSITPLTKEEFKDPYWFKIKSGVAVNTGIKEENTFLLRFADDKPSIRNNEKAIAFLYVIKEPVVDENSFIHRKDLRPLGKVVISNL
ncbi:MAG: PrsW family intramembrane metalloprotease [Cytophagaceae bacterium]